jgi:putative ABC transport system substrate-binding protein
VFVKLMEVALDAFPAARRIAVLLNPNELAPRESLPGLEALAQQRGVRLVRPDVTGEEQLLAWAADLAHESFDAVIVTAMTSTWHRRRELVAALGRASIPAVYEAPIFVEEGGLMSYGPYYGDNVPRVTDYLERVLTGTDPATLPILQPTRLDLVINLKAARAQGIALPPAILRRADRIVQ